eukprot:scaffold179170_cov13-Tisochrysis_lutea.AAC.1
MQLRTEACALRVSKESLTAARACLWKHAGYEGNKKKATQGDRAEGFLDKMWASQGLPACLGQRAGLWHALSRFQILFPDEVQTLPFQRASHYI